MNNKYFPFLLPFRCLIFLLIFVTGSGITGKNLDDLSNIWSIAASAVPYRQAIYSSSKAALEQSIKCIAKEFLPRRIRVNGIAAGAVQTEMFSELEKNSENFRLRMEKYYPLGIIDPSKIVRAIIYLLSDDSAHIDGTIMRYDSGFMINR